MIQIGDEEYKFEWELRKPPSSETYSQVNLYGFTQLRIVGEDNTIEAYDPNLEIKHADFLNPRTD